MTNPDTTAQPEDLPPPERERKRKRKRVRSSRPDDPAVIAAKRGQFVISDYRPPPLRQRERTAACERAA